MAGKKAESRIPERITKAIKGNRLSHAYIIEGDELTEKTKFAIDFAKAILCKVDPGIGCGECKTCRMISEGTYRDIYLVTKDERSVKDKDIEELQERLAKLPIEMGVDDGGRNIAIVESADTMTTRAQNRFLKSLEEPQPGTVIMLLSENDESLLPTIKSRCQKIHLYETDLDYDENYRSIARAIIDMFSGRNKRKAYFFEGKRIIEENLKGRDSALGILDALEREFRKDMLSVANSDSATEDILFLKRGIEAVEGARKDIRYNVREKYALCDLLLKIGG